ncbi:MAG: hypothetical protein P4L77_11995 [Sulfuriferula sp.]|nr:hypothetical protein [Sulfuriferula sp.]
MGVVRPIKQANGNIGLEITYGGKEAPFGGVDSSAPPAYIDPRCFAKADGFLVVDNKLIVASLQKASIPAALWNNVVGVKLLGIGTFYNSINGQLNYALGYTAVRFGSVGISPTGTDYVFYITSWDPADVTQYWTDLLQITLYDAMSVVEQASLTLDCIASGSVSTSAATGATAEITAVDSQGFITAVTVSGGTGYFATQYLNIVQNGTLNALYQVDTVDGSGAILTGTLIEGGLYGTYTVGAANVIPINDASVGVTINGPAGGPNTYTVNALSTDYSRQGVVALLASNITTDPNVSVAASTDGYSLVFTSKLLGVDGNSITVQDHSVNADPTVAPPFYFSAKTARNLEGGQLTISTTAPLQLTNTASITAVGGTIYIGNVGPMILKYSGPGLFTTSTLYTGVQVLRKFAGSMLGICVEPQLGTLIQNTDMVLAWSAAGNLDEWSPLTSQGFVTGAGFEQLADVGDYLAGLIISNGTAFIIRSQGISYVTPTGNAALPFATSHKGLGDRGEGAQVQQLVCQYDETGVYVGGSNIYQLSGQIQSIGDKIANDFFATLQSTSVLGNSNLMGSVASTVLLGGSELPLVAFNIPYNSSNVKMRSFVFNPTNATWMGFTYANGTGIGAIDKVTLGVFSRLNSYSFSQLFNQADLSYAFQQEISGTLLPPSFFSLLEGVPNVNSISNQAQVYFPVEEVLFGRDITIDSLYVALNGSVSENTYVDFYLNDVLYSTLIMTPATFNSVDLNTKPIETSLYPLPTRGVGAFTVKSPQLSAKIRSLTDAGSALIRFTKIMLLGSFDEAQRPT